MKRLFLIVFASVLAFLASEECKAQYSALKFGDFGVSSVTPVSLSSVKGSVWVDVENPLSGFSVSSIEGKLYKNGVALIEGRVDDYYVATGTSKLTLTGQASLCPGASIFDVLGLILFEAELYTVDIRAVITDDGAEPSVKEVKNIPVLTLLMKNENDNPSLYESKDSK